MPLAHDEPSVATTKIEEQSLVRPRKKYSLIHHNSSCGIVYQVFHNISGFNNTRGVK